MTMYDSAGARATSRNRASYDILQPPLGAAEGLRKGGGHLARRRAAGAQAASRRGLTKALDKGEGSLGFRVHG